MSAVFDAAAWSHHWDPDQLIVCGKADRVEFSPLIAKALDMYSTKTSPRGFVDHYLSEAVRLPRRDYFFDRELALGFLIRTVHEATPTSNPVHFDQAADEVAERLRHLPWGRALDIAMDVGWGDVDFEWRVGSTREAGHAITEVLQLRTRKLIRSLYEHMERMDLIVPLDARDSTKGLRQRGA